MRNLVSIHRGKISLESRQAPDLPLVSTFFDPVSDTVFCAFGPSEDFATVEIQQIHKNGRIATYASWEVPTPMRSDLPVDKVLDMKYFADTDYVIVIFAGGDIVKVQAGEAEDESGETPAYIEIVGSIEEGIEAAQWSPDEEVLALTTAVNTFILLSRMFEPLSENTISPADLAISRHVSVGWGKAETQFRGKGAKAGMHPLRDPTVPEMVDIGQANASDSFGAKISWRGDGEYVSLTTIDSIEDGTIQRRTIRVYSRGGSLDSVSEPVDGLEAQVAWKPSGNLIASIQRKPSAELYQVVFFERNGLRRGEFTLPISIDEEVVDLAWNIDSDVLAVHLTNRVQLWTTKNYHWYLKQEIYPRSLDRNDVDRPFALPRFIKWHPEKSLALLMGYDTNTIEIHEFSRDIISGPTCSPNDIGNTVVIDGSNIKITPLKVANTPPPMSYTSFRVRETPVSVAVNNDNTYFAVISSTHVDVASWEIGGPKRPLPPKVQLSIPLNAILEDNEAPRKVAFAGKDTLFVLADAQRGSRVIALKLNISEDESFDVLASHYVSPDILILKSQADYSAVVFETADGSVSRITEQDPSAIEFIVTFPQKCHWIEVSERKDSETGEPIDDIPTAYGLTTGGRLYANERQISNGVTSISITQHHIIFTTAQHYLKFVHLNADVSQIQVPEDTEKTQGSFEDERCRAIERGSLMVSVMPSKTALVLQAPRGNLETIFPRMMVLNGVRRKIEQNEYRDAFVTCRVHRVDLNILHDHAPLKFFENVKHFIDQLATGEYLDLFLSMLKEEDVSQSMYKETFAIENKLSTSGADLPISELQSLSLQPPVKESKINKICDAILAIIMDSSYKSKYLSSILTAYACKSPPDLESALTLIGTGRSSGSMSADEIERAIEHLCFLQDVNSLYDTALGLYDLDLTLLVAQQSQKDPKEYLPFLQGLQERSLLRRKFEIDTCLKRFSKALSALAEIAKDDTSVFSELQDYVVEHELYKSALAVYKYNDEEKQNAIYELYASHLQGKALYREAGITYEMLGNFKAALDCYELDGCWQEALAILDTHTEFKSIKEAVTMRLADVKYEARDYKAAAIINLEYLGNIREAVRILCKGFFFEEALRIITRKTVPTDEDLIKLVVMPGLLEGFSQISELVSDCKVQVTAQVQRLRELRHKKTIDPVGFFNGPDESDAPDNVSIAGTVTTSGGSVMTRYTGKTAGTAKTGASRKTAKNRKREERKKARGKKGSIYEEEYLINSMGRLIERLETTKPDAIRLIEGLWRSNMKTHAYEIQKAYADVLETLKSVVTEVFTISERDRERVDEEGITYLIDPPVVPVVKSFEKFNVLDF